jgi:hypothetical protein
LAPGGLIEASVESASVMFSVCPYADALIGSESDAASPFTSPEPNVFGCSDTETPTFAEIDCTTMCHVPDSSSKMIGIVNVPWVGPSGVQSQTLPDQVASIIGFGGTQFFVYESPPQRKQVFVPPVGELAFATQGLHPL